MSPPPTPGVPETHADRSPGIHQQLNTLSLRMGQLESRMGAVEGHTAQSVKDLEAIKGHTARFAGYEATAKTWIARGILLVLGSVGSTYGVTRITMPHQEPQRTQIVKSATTVKVEACTAMQAGPARDQCAINILTELMGPKGR